MIRIRERRSIRSLLTGRKILYEGPGLSLEGVNLPSVNFRNADLRGVCLARCNLCDAILDGADLARANLERADLRDASLRGTRLYRAKLVGCRFSSAFLSGTRLDYAVADWAVFSNAQLRGASGVGAMLRHCDFSNAMICSFKGWCNFTGCDLTGSSFSHTALFNVYLKDADLCGVDFRGAGLCAVDFETRTTIMGGKLGCPSWIYLKGASYDGFTLFPPDFDPRLAGMVRRR
jgi:uncharacterized protein YjbI with pentapeptide repeats